MDGTLQILVVFCALMNKLLYIELSSINHAETTCVYKCHLNQKTK